MKALGSTQEVRLILHGSSAIEGNGIPGVGVKSVDIRRNTNGEGSSGVEPRDFTPDLIIRLRALYAQ